MKIFLKTTVRTIAEFMSSPVKRCLLFIAIISLIALGEFLFLGLARRTFVFYTTNSGIIVVEDRMLKHSKSREGDIIRYTEETLLGSVSPDLLPLFPRETELKSLLYRNGVVYVNFSKEAAFPPEEGGNVLNNFRTFYAGILRNFSYVKDVRLFIEGNVVYLEESKHGDIEAPLSFSEI
ncbi:MAG: GerMN domain-containing protein [Treponema sp.]|jgi:spore germination protein GerM|nr:GerMN domain-containing protein [Treponema sp.]